MAEGRGRVGGEGEADVWRALSAHDTAAYPKYTTRSVRTNRPHTWLHARCRAACCVLARGMCGVRSGYICGYTCALLLADHLPAASPCRAAGRCAGSSVASGSGGAGTGPSRRRQSAVHSGVRSLGTTLTVRERGVAAWRVRRRWVELLSGCWDAIAVLQAGRNAGAGSLESSVRRSCWRARWLARSHMYSVSVRC